MKDFFYEIQPGVGGALRLIVNEADESPRARPNLDRLALDNLRSGTPAAALAQQLILNLSTWLLANDVARLRLQDALNRGDPLRLVIKVNPQLLDTDLADVPFELLEMPATAPLVLDPRVRSMVHILPKVSSVPFTPANRDWPLRIVIIRSNPDRLGGAVPPALALQQHIIKRANNLFGGGLVDVQLISREPGVDAPATWQALRNVLEKGRPPHILAYLGHADLAAGHDGGTPIGRLQFESDDGVDGAPVPAAILSSELQEFPVPVVVLAGCYTAAQLKNKVVIDPLVPDWMRAHQGIAQALINSGSAVQIAVGMRYRLETADATRFLEKFFDSLIEPPNPGGDDLRGDVEQAVRAARFELRVNPAATPFSYSAPAVFRAPTSSEPMFAFLRSAPVLADRADDAAQRTREDTWNKLCGVPIVERNVALKFIGAALSIPEDDVIARTIAKNVPMLVIRQIDDMTSTRTYGECAAGGKVKMAVELCGDLTASRVVGTVRVEDNELEFSTPKGTKALLDAGFKSLFDANEDGEPNLLHFELQAKGAMQAGAPLPAGRLFTFDLTVDQEFPKVHVITIQLEDVSPKSPLRGWSNAVLVSP